MFKLILMIARVFVKEPCSLHREIINRSHGKRSSWDHSSSELLELYEYLAVLAKKRTRAGTLNFKEVSTLMKHPTTSLNFFRDRKIQLNDLERFRLIIKKG